MWLKNLFSRNYLDWEEYENLVYDREIILFFDSVVRENIRNEVKKNGF